MKNLWKVVICFLYMLLHTEAGAQQTTPLELSLGVVSDQLQSSAVRALVRYADKNEVDEKLIDPEKPLFFQLSRKLTIDTTNDNKFGGVRLRYGVLAFNLPYKEVNGPQGEKIKVNSDFGQVYGLRLGFDTDKSLKTKDYLIEGQLMPFSLSSDPCFKLTPSNGVALIGQIGRSEQTNGGSAKTLQRLKIEGNFESNGRCIARIFSFRDSASSSNGTSKSSAGSLMELIGTDISKWEISANAQLWRDFEVSQSYRRYELGLRIPVGTGKMLDFRRIVGVDAPTFVKGSQFSANLTVSY